MANIYLVCEGERGGLDDRILDLAIAQTHGLPILLRAAGGDTAIRAVGSYLEERSRRERPNRTLGDAVDIALGVCDRDYRRREEAERTWCPDSRLFMWRRHEIENYLLQPEILDAAFESLRRTVDADWVSELPQGLGETTELLKQIAEPLLEDHAGNVLAWEVRAHVQEKVGTTLTIPTPPNLPDTKYSDRDGWLEAISDDMIRFKGACASVPAMAFLQQDRIEKRYEDILSHASRPEFMEELGFLADMDGHKLLWSLGRHLYGLGARRLTDETIQNELVQSFGATYRPGAQFEPDDFQDLAERIRARASR